MGAGAGTCNREGALGDSGGGRGGRGPRAPEPEALAGGGRGEGPGEVVVCVSATCPAGAAGLVGGPPEEAAVYGRWATVGGWMSATVSLIQCGATSCSRVTSLQGCDSGSGARQEHVNNSQRALFSRKPEKLVKACCRNPAFCGM